MAEFYENNDNIKKSSFLEEIKYEANKLNTIKMNNNKKALIVSGGGAFGAWGGGLASNLIRLKGKKYDYFVGTSTGALIVPFCALGEFDVLKEAYTSLSPNFIYNVNPFNKKGRLSIYKSVFRVIFSMITSKIPRMRILGIGDTESLRDLIEDYYTDNFHSRLTQMDKKVIVSVFNLTLRKVEYKTLNDLSYEDACDWMWLSTLAPLFTTPKYKDGYLYCDAGIVENTAITSICEDDIMTIDVILHSSNVLNKELMKTYTYNNIIDVMSGVLGAMIREIHEGDFEGILYRNGYKRNISIYRIPVEDDGNLVDAMRFDSVMMDELWYRGSCFGDENVVYL